MVGCNWRSFGGTSGKDGGTRNISKEHRLNRRYLQLIHTNTKAIDAAVEIIAKLPCTGLLSLPILDEKRLRQTSLPLAPRSTDVSNVDILKRLSNIKSRTTVQPHHQPPEASRSRYGSTDIPTPTLERPPSATSHTKTSLTNQSRVSSASRRAVESGAQYGSIGTVIPKNLAFPVDKVTDRLAQSRSEIRNSSTLTAARRPLIRPKRKTPLDLRQADSNIIDPLVSDTHTTPGMVSPLIQVSHASSRVGVHSATEHSTTAVASQYHMRKFQLTMEAESDRSGGSMLDFSWVRLQTLQRENSSATASADVQGFKSSQLVDVLNANHREFHRHLKQEGKVFHSHVVYYGDRSSGPGAEKRKAQRNFTDKDIVRLTDVVHRLTHSDLFSDTDIKKRVLMSGVSDGTRVINYANGRPAIIQSCGLTCGYYYVILDTNIVHGNCVRGIVTPTGACSFYHPNGDLWYIHSGRCGMCFHSNGRTMRQWNPASDPAPPMQLKLNEYIAVQVRPGTRYAIHFTCAKEKVLITTTRETKADPFTFNTSEELRNKYGQLAASNDYSSMASRDHRSYLHTFKHRPVDQRIAEGSEIMKTQAIKTMNAGWKFTPPFPNRKTSLGKDMVDYYIKSLPSQPSPTSSKSSDDRRRNLSKKTGNGFRRRQAVGESRSRKPTSKKSMGESKISAPSTRIETTEATVRSNSTTRSLPAPGAKQMVQKPGVRADLAVTSLTSKGAAISDSATARSIPASGAKGFRTEVSLMTSKKRSLLTPKIASRQWDELLGIVQSATRAGAITDVKGWCDDDPLMKHYVDERIQLTNKINRILKGWSLAMLQYLGMSQAYSQVLTKRLFSAVRKEYQLSTDYLETRTT